MEVRFDEEPFVIEVFVWLRDLGPRVFLGGKVVKLKKRRSQTKEADRGYMEWIGEMGMKYVSGVLRGLDLVFAAVSQ